ncbi:MAG: ACT domain-containing protein [Clostridiales bacterium]|jgi:chorismate mutase/prephenate dehydratase|nr:ACT domain-containing protein [Clostridiales bacterium]
MDELLRRFDKVYCQGIEGAYSHIAARQLFPHLQPVFLKSFEEVCMSVSRDGGSAGILPFENSTAGIVSGIVRLLLKRDLCVATAKEIRIRHVLCAKNAAPLSAIERVFSHQQALLQCSEFLSRLDAEQIETPNTAISAIMASNDEASAAICSEEAAQIYGLEIIEENICNSDNNMTRFIVIARDFAPSPDADVTSVYFKVKNESGALFKVLKVFADHGVNLISLHSLPLEDEPWHYGFYVDIEGSLGNEGILRSLEEAKEKAQFLRVLGSYRSRRA